MNYYAYIPDSNGNEPLGTENRIVRREYSTIRGMINYLNRKCDWNDKPYVIQSFTHFYDRTSFKTEYTNKYCYETVS